MRWVTPTVAGPAEDAGELSLSRSPIEEELADLLAGLDRTTPDVVLSYDDGGGYGHPDHVLAHQLSRAVATALGLPFWEIVSAPKDAEAQSEDEVETHDITPWLDRKRASLRAYATQLTVDGDEIVHVGGQRQAIETIEQFRLRTLE